MKRALLVATAIALTVSAAELSVRAAALDERASSGQVQPGNLWDQDCAVPVDRIGYALKAGACGANSQGMHDNELPDPSPEDELRILALGDSITHGRMYTDYLEDLLGSALDRPVEVLNAGVPGYAPTNELEWFRARGAELEPDLVILQLCTNDYGFTPFVFRSKGEVVKIVDRSGGLSKRSLAWFEASALYRYWVYSQLRIDAGAAPFEQRALQTDQTILELQALAHARGVPLVMFLVPRLAPEAAWPTEQRKTAARIRQLAAGHDIPFVDLTEPMLSPDPEPLRRYRSQQTRENLAEALQQLGFPEATRWLQQHPTTRRYFAKTMMGRQDQDYVHPNFLGHYLMARVLTDVLMEPSSELLAAPR